MINVPPISTANVLYRALLKIVGISAFHQAYFSVKVLAVCRDALFIPIEGIFRRAAEGAVALLVRHSVVAVRVDSCPVYRSAENLHAHLGEKRQVLFPVVIKIDAPAEGVMGRVGGGQRVGEASAGHIDVAVFLAGRLVPGRVKIAQVLRIEALAALVPGAVGLRSRDCAAPEKVFGKSGFHKFALLQMFCQWLCNLLCNYIIILSFPVCKSRHHKSKEMRIMDKKMGFPRDSGRK